MSGGLIIWQSVRTICSFTVLTTIFLRILYLHLRRTDSVINNDTLGLVYLLSFFPLIPLSDRNLCSLLLAGNRRDRLETLTRCAEWFHFGSITFLGNLTYCKLSLFFQETESMHVDGGSQCLLLTVVRNHWLCSLHPVYQYGGLHYRPKPFMAYESNAIL